MRGMMRRSPRMFNKRLPDAIHIASSLEGGQDTPGTIVVAISIGGGVLDTG